METFDAAVVGGGPAGSSAAWQLARAGWKVVVFDRAEHPRYKTCGGGLVRRAAKELPVDVGGPANIGGLVLSAAEMHVVDLGRVFRVERAEPLLWMAMRAELDHACLRAAGDAGAELRHPCAVEGVDAEADRVRLATASGPVAARFVLAADGALSRTAAAAGWREPPYLAPALEWEVRVPEADRARFAGAARFDFGLVDDGYAWVFPKARHLSLGVLSMRRGRGDLKAMLRRYLELLGLPPTPDADEHGFVIPVRPRPGPPARGRVLLLGDAYGLADPITAEGISPALISGRVAAEALVASEGDPARARRGYERRLRRALLRDFAVAKRLAGLIYGSNAWRNRLFGRFGQKMCEAMVDQIGGVRTYRELLLHPKSYARLFFGRVRRSPARASP